VAQARRSTNLQISGSTIRSTPLDVRRLLECSVVFLAVPADLAREIAPALRESGIATVDNSSAFRMDASVPLVVPEVNGDDLTGSFVANPNCATILLLLAVGPLHRAFTCTDIRVCTYQAVSGAGRGQLDRLRTETGAALRGEDDDSTRTPAGQSSDSRLRMAFNIWSHESAIDPTTGMNDEETKIMRETSRILGTGISVSATCIRVPVERVHGEAVTVDFVRPVQPSAVKDVLEHARGVLLVDGPGPSARDASGLDDVLVGRIRADVNTRRADGTSTRYHFWLAGDQLRKGAALNAVQIAERMGYQSRQRAISAVTT